MKLKNKLIITITILLVVLLILPLILVNLAKPYKVMGIMMLLFFVVNPITTAIINFMVGKDLKKIWWMPILFSIVFLLCYWIVLKEVILDLLFYAGIYLIIGLVFMIISVFVTKRKK